MIKQTNNIYKLRDNTCVDEKTLLVKLSLGHESAFAAIYDRYWKMVYGTAERFLQSSTHAQDIVQEVFTSVWTHRAEFVEVENLEAYIKTMARNRIYSELRLAIREEKNKTSYLFSVETSVNNCDFSILNDQNEQLLEGIVNQLPPRQQEIFNLARKEGLSHDKIAERLNVSNGTVKNHMVRALQTIRSYLMPQLNSNLTLLIAWLVF